MVRPFHLHPRKVIFYVQFVDPETGHRLAAKSTGKTNRDEALMVVYGWLNHGIPDGRTPSGLRAVQEEFSVNQIVSRIGSTSLDIQDVKKVLAARSEKGFLVSASVADAPGSEPFGEYTGPRVFGPPTWLRSLLMGRGAFKLVGAPVRMGLPLQLRTSTSWTPPLGCCCPKHRM